MIRYEWDEGNDTGGLSVETPTQRAYSAAQRNWKWLVAIAIIIAVVAVRSCS